MFEIPAAVAVCAPPLSRALCGGGGGAGRGWADRRDCHATLPPLILLQYIKAHTPNSLLGQGTIAQMPQFKFGFWVGLLNEYMILERRVLSLYFLTEVV